MNLFWIDLFWIYFAMAKLSIIIYHFISPWQYSHIPTLCHILAFVIFLFSIKWYNFQQLFGARVHTDHQTAHVIDLWYLLRFRQSLYHKGSSDWKGNLFSPTLSTLLRVSLSTQRLASFLIHLCLSCFFGYNLFPYANFLKLTKTYQFMWVYNSDINKIYIWELRPVKVILNIVWHWKWATYINLFIWRKNHSAWFASKCPPP